MGKFIRSIIAFVAIICVGLIVLIVVNQFDEPLNPELQKILNVEQKITSEQITMYKEVLATNACSPQELTPPVRQALQKIIDAGGLVVPKPELYGSACLSHFIGDKGDAYFETLHEDFKLHKDHAIDNMRNLLTALANTVTGDNTLIIRLLALGGLKHSLENLDKFGRVSIVGFMGLTRSLVSPEVVALLNRNPQEIMQAAAESELRMTDALLRKSREEVSSIGIASGSDGMSPPQVAMSRFMWMFYQHNRTMNRLYENWLIEKAADKSCMETQNCPESHPQTSFTMKDYFVNPAGTQIVKAFSWRLSRASTKIQKAQDSMKVMIEQMSKAEAPK